MGGGVEKKEHAVGRGAGGVRRLIWGVQSEDFHQQLSVQQWVMAHLMV